MTAEVENNFYFMCFFLFWTLTLMSHFDIYWIISTHLFHEVILVAIQKTIEYMRCSFVGDPTKSDDLGSSDTAAVSTINNNTNFSLFSK